MCFILQPIHGKSFTVITLVTFSKPGSEINSQRIINDGASSYVRRSSAQFTTQVVSKFV